MEKLESVPPIRRQTRPSAIRSSSNSTSDDGGICLYPNNVNDDEEKKEEEGKEKDNENSVEDEEQSLRRRPWHPQPLAAPITGSDLATSPDRGDHGDREGPKKGLGQEVGGNSTQYYTQPTAQKIMDFSPGTFNQELLKLIGEGSTVFDHQSALLGSSYAVPSDGNREMKDGGVQEVEGTQGEETQDVVI